MRYTEIDSTTAQLKFFGYISEWWISASDFTDTLNEIERKYKNLVVLVHCYGGSVMEGNVMYNAMLASKLNITMRIVGVSASMMTIVMLGAKTVEAYDNALVMIHEPTGWCDGNAKAFFEMGNLLKSMTKSFSKVYIAKTGKKQADIDALFDGADHWFSAQECVDMKLVDKIVEGTGGVVESISKPDKGEDVKSVFGRYAAILKPDSKHKNSDMDKAQIIAKAGLTGVTAESSDTAVLDALVITMKAQNDKIKLLEDGAAATAKTTATAMIAGREKELNTQFTAEQKASFEAVAVNAGVATLATVLASMSATPQVQQMLSPEMKAQGGQAGAVPVTGGANPRASWTFDEWQEKDPDGLEKLPKAELDKLYLAKYPNGAGDLK